MRSRQPTSLERVRFGSLRTLNVRARMLTGVESAARVEAWLRSKQVELSGEVLVITGRGAGSLGGIPVIKEATRRMLNRLRRLGVVESYGEDTGLLHRCPRSAAFVARGASAPCPPLRPRKNRASRVEGETRERPATATRSIEALG
jgi:hypothetical protein